MPNEDKRAIPFSSGGFTRGYIGMGEESGSDRLEVKEAFSYGYEWREDNKERGTEGNPMQGPNRWPSPISFPSSHRESLNGYYKEACRVSHAVTKGLALALGEKEEFLDKFCENGDSISLMRLFKYYPYSHGDAVAASLSPGDEMKERERTGSSPHTDWGFLTLIMQQGDVTGLELWHKEAWHPVPPIPGTLLVNIGDYISLLTKGSFKSPLHRVTTGEKERTSFTFFYYPSYESSIPQIEVPHDSSIIYTNQATGEAIDPSEIEGRPFGEFIMRKWESVSRQT